MRGFLGGTPRSRGRLQRSTFGRLGTIGTSTLLVASSMFFFTGAAVVTAAGGTTNNGDTTCGYPDSNTTQFPVAATTFVESTVLRNVGVVGVGSNAKIVAYANDEKGLLLGVKIAGTSPNGTPLGGSPTPFSNGAVVANSTLGAALVQNVATTSLTVASSSGFAVNDLLSLTSGAKTQANIKISAIPNATHLTVVSFKPNFAYPIGTMVRDTTQAAGGPVYGHASNPNPGNLDATDASITGGTASRPQYPALYITNLTAHPLVAGKHGVGDWQAVNGQPQPDNRHIDDVFGTWLTATITNGTYALDSLPPSNHWVLGASAGGGTNYDDPSTVTFAAGPTTFATMGDEGYGTEIRWNATGGAHPLRDSDGQTLVAGNKYRIQIIDHDGDQNKAGGDTGEYCTTLVIPVAPNLPTTPNSTTAGSSQTIKAALGTTLYDSAYLSGVPGFGDVTGTIDFHLFRAPVGATPPDPATPCTVAGSFTNPFNDLAKPLTIDVSNTATVGGSSHATSGNFSTASTNGALLNQLGTFFWQDHFNSTNPNYLDADELCANEVVKMVDAHLVLTPHAAINEVGHVHTITATVQTTEDGTTFTAVNGALVTLTIDTAITDAHFTNAAGTTTLGNSTTCTTDATGTCPVYLIDNTAQGVDVSGTTTFTKAGVVGSFTRSATGVGVNDAHKTFVDANIVITPPDAVNEVNNAHIFTITANAFPADATPVTFNSITPTLTGGVPNVTDTNTCTTPGPVLSNGGNTATCTYTINSNSAAAFTLNASTSVTMGGTTPAGATAVTVTRSTSGNPGPGGSTGKTKTFVDAKIVISPDDATNIVGNAHQFTITVTGLPAGNASTTAISINPTLTGVPAVSIVPPLNPDLDNSNTCAGPLTVTANVATCTYTINSSTPGVFTLNASASVTVGGVTVTRDTAPDGSAAGPGGSGPKTKTYIEPKTQLTVSDQLTGLTANATGHVTYTAFHSAADCGFLDPITGDQVGQNGTDKGTVTVGAGGVVPLSGSVLVGPQVGAFGTDVWWSATYTGNLGTFTTACTESASSN